MIYIKDVEYMAGLARLELQAEEKKKFQKDLESILEFVEKLKRLDVEGVEPTTAGAEAANVMRADQTHSKHNQQNGGPETSPPADRDEGGGSSDDDHNSEEFFYSGPPPPRHRRRGCTLWGP